MKTNFTVKGEGYAQRSCVRGQKVSVYIYNIGMYIYVCMYVYLCTLKMYIYVHFCIHT